MSQSELALDLSTSRHNKGVSIIAGDVQSCGDKSLEEFHTGSYLTQSSNPYRPLSQRYSKATMDLRSKDTSSSAAAAVVEDSSPSANSSWRNSRLFRIFSCCSNPPPPQASCSDDNIVASIVFLPTSVRIRDFTPGHETPIQTSPSYEKTYPSHSLSKLPKVPSTQLVPEEQVPAKSVAPPKPPRKFISLAKV